MRVGPPQHGADTQGLALHVLSQRQPPTRTPTAPFRWPSQKMGSGSPGEEGAQTPGGTHVTPAPLVPVGAMSGFPPCGAHCPRTHSARAPGGSVGSPPPEVSDGMAVALLWGCCFPRGPSPTERLRAGCLASPASVLCLGEEEGLRPSLSRGQTQVPAMLEGQAGAEARGGPSAWRALPEQCLWPGLGGPQPLPVCP